MKQFFGAFFGSIVGILVATLLSMLLVFVIVKASIGSALGSGETRTEVTSDQTVLKLDLEGRLIERERENPFEQLGDVTPFVDAESAGLNSLVNKLRTAAADEKIKGLYIRLGDLNSGIASVHELRKAIVAFKKSGKFVYCYSEDYSQLQYYLASAGDRVFLHPEGSLLWKGLSMNLLFFKNALEKLDVDMQVFRHGKFKSAIEPLVLDKMSQANREQSEVFLSSIWQSLLAEVSASRNIPVEELNAMADGLRITVAEDAVGTFIDKLAYEDEIIDEIRKKTGTAKDEKPPFVDCDGYVARGDLDGKVGAGRIAVIYANGAITSGDGSDDEAGSDRLSRALREAREDEKVKAIVLRVNSPGGSALASDVIWREVTLARKAKPTVVSMGDVAASGGYYISCGADRIFAQPNTITGSIGVFGVIPNLGRSLENKLGITMDTVNTNRYSDLGSGLRAVAERERQYIQRMVERVYDTFTARVSEGRHLSRAEVDSLGQGRVWAGSDALKLKLVDEMGGLRDAIAFAAKKAGLTEYRVTELPRLKGPFDGLFNNTEKEVAEKLMSGSLAPVYAYWKHLAHLLKMDGVQARLPYDLIIR